MDYGALPPEVNSARIYSGPGSGSMLAAAAAWDGLASELYAVATSYGAVTSSLAGTWTGPAAQSMTQASAPYIAWLGATAVRAEHAAAQAAAAAGAFEAAHAATVPPPLIAANRSLLMSLVATNVLGQNGPAIAAAEAQYDQMWAQDTAVMYGYAGASAAASLLTPFVQPPTTTDPRGLTRQGVAVTQTAGSTASTPAQELVANGSQLISALPQALQGLAAVPTATSMDAALTSLTSYVSKFNTLTTPIKFATYPMTFLNQALSASKAVTAPAAAAKAVESGLASGVSAGTHALAGLGTGDSAAAFSAGRGVSIGALSVPHGWLTASTTGSVAGAPPNASSTIAPATGPSGGGPAGLPLVPLTNTAGRGGAGPAASRFELRPRVIPHSPAAG
ncbi:putative PPE family protein PPE29 [Mycobacterium basiliense]|uniref:Putative PPE family protein PPE29 n=1 Tax=Mycobacterium basiliense TaxID=2094119 RepID=A0A3S4BDD3_9MYCO|nr:PPE family protein [Mycobacterium basiliense]VDM88113.1 putative PPE family protein PPE29 [Mycobacterium basiliense]